MRLSVPNFSATIGLSSPIKPIDLLPITISALLVGCKNSLFALTKSTLKVAWIDVSKPSTMPFKVKKSSFSPNTPKEMQSFSF